MSRNLESGDYPRLWKDIQSFNPKTKKLSQRVGKAVDDQAIASCSPSGLHGPALLIFESGFGGFGSFGGGFGGLGSGGGFGHRPSGGGFGYGGFGGGFGGFGRRRYGYRG
ncbi:uncharacterized protein LOC135218864 [Macrobrachium nipponense]|uniref:uncharacterized protein LOC135218864 n=1 Tax=Macrobrachium nipponense TaxID=159736 RepID=UPI0030C7AD02